MKKKMGRKRIPEKDRSKVLLQVRYTAAEDRALKRLTKEYGEVYITRVVRRLIKEACEEMEAAKQKGEVSNG